MKKVILFALAFVISVSSFAQKSISHDDLKSFSKGAMEIMTFDSYLASDGYSYKVGDTLKIGMPSSNKTFAFITEGSALQTPYQSNVSSAGTNTVIKKIYVNGNNRMGYRITIVGKGICGICPQYYINMEEAMASGEVKTKGMTSDEAMSQLKKGKDKLDLGIITQEEFDKMKEELVKYIK
jgi:hypothetical protein